MGQQPPPQLGTQGREARSRAAPSAITSAVVLALMAAVSAVCPGAAGAQGPEQIEPASFEDLRLSAKLDRRNIIPYEPLWLTVTLKNVSRRSVLLSAAPGVPICRLEGPDGRPLEWGAARPTLLVASQTVLAAGEARQSEVELNHLFNLGGRSGRHRVIVAYPILQIGAGRRRGRLRELKAVLSFRVSDPQEQADREALPDFRRAIEQHMAWRGMVREVVRSAYQEVAEEHAGSRYAEYAQYWLARSLHNPVDYRRAREAYRAFLDEHPRSGYAEAARRGLEQLGALAEPEPAGDEGQR
ncbi:MAG: tol-pal system YbgF family protein [Armatimonadota bacterium]